MKQACIKATTTSFISLLLVAVLDWGAVRLNAIEREWKPSLSNNRWSHPNNWDPAGVPVNGDSLVFLGDGLLGQDGTMVNDLTGLTIGSLIFGEFQAGGETEWNLSGNTLMISERIVLASENETPVYIHCGLVLAQNATFGVSFFSTEGLHITGPIDLNGYTLSLTPEMDTSVDLSGVISGNGSLSLRLSGPQFGGGTAKLSGPEANTFVGTVTSVSREASYVALPGHLLGVRLELDKQSEPAVPGSLILGTNCSAILKRSHQIADNSTVTIRAGGRVLLEGNTETIGSLNFLGGRNGDWAYGALETLVDTGGATLSVLGNITSDHRYTNNLPTIKGKLGLPPGNHLITVSGDQFYGLDIHAQILGDGGFTKNGPSALLLQGNNIFNGELTVTEGILEARHDNALGSVAGFTILSNNATLLLNDVGIFGESLFVRGNLAFSSDSAGLWLEAVGMNVWSGPVILDTNLVLTGFNGGVVNLNGRISGPGGLHCLSGTIELSGADANTFTGTTLVRNPLLLLNKSSGVAAFGGPLVVGSALGSPSEVRWLGAYQRLYGSVTLFEGAYVNLNDLNDDFGPITFNGGTISTGTGELGVYGLVMANAASSTPTIDGRLGLPPGLHEVRVSEGSPLPDLRINATVIGSGSLRKTGPGQMWLAAANSYAGLTTVAEGTLSILNPDALGASSSGTTVNEGATLDLNAVSGTVREPLALRGTGDSGVGALNAFGIVTLRNPTPSIFAAIDLTANTTIRVGPGSLLTVDGFISGLGPLTKIGAGTLHFINANENTYSGDTVIREGTLDLGKPNNVISVPGDLVLGPATASSPASARWLQTGPMKANSLVTVNAASLLDLNGFDQSLARLNLNDGGRAQTGAGRLNLISGGIVQVGSLSPFGSHATASIAGRIGLPANNHVSFNVVPFADFPPFAGGPELDVPALISVNGFESPSFDPAGFSKGSLGWMRLSANNTYKGVTFVDGGTLQVEGSQPQSAAQMNNGGRLLGSGTIGHVDFSGSSGVIAPGTSPGILTTSNFNVGANAGGVLQIELNGTAPGSGYDQLNVRGTVRLLGISLNGSLNFPSAVGNEFTIINNDGSDGVIGTFNGLPQNANVYIGDEQFTISYTGGTGNDVVLTRVFTPPRPALKIETIGTNLVRLLWATNDPAYRLEFTTNLPATTWIPASDARVIVGTNYVVTNATSGIASLSVLTPVAWYRLGEHDAGAASGLAATNATDSAGAKHLKGFGNALYTGAVSPDAATQVASSLGVQLNGSGQYFRNDFLTPVVNNFGIEAWVKPNIVSSTYHFVAYNGNTAGDGWGIAWQGGGFQGWYGNVVLFGSGGVTPGTWAHVALVRDDGASTLYVNGVPANPPTGFGPNTPTGGFALGIRPQAPASEFFNGAIDEVRVFTFAPGQFTTNDLLLNQPFTQTTNPPVRFYRLFKP